MLLLISMFVIRESKYKKKKNYQGVSASNRKLTILHKNESADISNYRVGKVYTLSNRWRTILIERENDSVCSVDRIVPVHAGTDVRLLPILLQHYSLRSLIVRCAVFHIYASLSINGTSVGQRQILTNTFREILSIDNTPSYFICNSIKTVKLKR